MRVFFDHISPGSVFYGHVRIHPLELGILFFNPPQSLQLVGTHAAVLALPVVVGRVTDAVLAADFLDR